MIMIVGEQPARPGEEALTGRSGERLARLAGLSYRQYLRRFERHNLCPSGWDDAAAAAAAARLEAGSDAGDAIVLLGARVIRAFGFERLSWYARATGRTGATLIAFPHPSGLSRYWNDPHQATEAANALRKIMEDFG